MGGADNAVTTPRSAAAAALASSDAVVHLVGLSSCGGASQHGCAPGAGTKTAANAQQQQQWPKTGTVPPARQAFELPTPLDVVVTAQAPQFITPLVSQQHATVPFNDARQCFKLVTPLFEGRAQLLLRNLPNTPERVFEGKRRQIILTVQGRFTQPGVLLSNLMLGSDFARPLVLPASPLLTSAALWLVRKMGGGVQLEPHGASPHVFAPLIAAAQVVNVARPGSEPADLCCVHEDMTCFDASLKCRSGQPLPHTKRRAHFSAASHRAGRCFDTEHVWTFQVYDHVVDYASFSLGVPLLGKIDLVQVLDGQPMQLLLRDMGSGLDALHLSVWHKRMLTHPANRRTNDEGETDAAAGDGI